MELVNKQSIVIDFYKSHMIPTYTFYQHDNNQIEFVIETNGEDADLSKVSRVLLNIKRPDGKVISRELDKNGNVILYKMQHEEMKASGFALLTLQFYNSDAERLSTAKIKIYFAATIEANVEFKDKEGTLYQQIIFEMDGLKDQLYYLNRTTKEQAEYAKEQGDAASSAAETASSEAANLSQLKTDVTEATEAASAAAEAAQTNADHAKTQGDYAKEQADVAAQRTEELNGLEVSQFYDRQEEFSRQLADNASKVNELMNNTEIIGTIQPVEEMIFDNVGITTEKTIDAHIYSTAILKVNHIEDGVIEAYGVLDPNTLIPLELISMSGSSQSVVTNIGLFYINNLGYKNLKFVYKPSVENQRFCTANLVLSFNQNKFSKIEHIRNTPQVGIPIINNGYEAPLFLKNDIVYGRREAILRKSVDYGKTWSTVGTLPANISSVLVADNGKITCVLNNNDVYTSDNNGANFTKMFTMTGGKAHEAFGYCAYKNLLLLAEYNSVKSPPTAKRVYMSEDGGGTWTTALELNDTPDNFHTHGVQYDPYEDIIWVVTGDGVQSKMIFYSKDRGKNWDKVAPWGKSPVQACTVIPLPECVLFIGDSFQVGVHRYVRPKTGTQKGQSFVFEQAMLLQNNWNPANEVPIPSVPIVDFAKNKAYFGWFLTPKALGGGDVLKNANIFATSDGFNFTQIFSTQQAVNGTGVGKGLGLTSYGEPTFHLNDANQGQYSHSTLKIPVTW